jgi:hypothetical protein
MYSNNNDRFYDRDHDGRESRDLKMRRGYTQKFLVDKPDLPGLQPRIAEVVIQKDYGPQFWLTAEFRSIFLARVCVGHATEGGQLYHPDEPASSTIDNQGSDQGRSTLPLQLHSFHHSSS